jgi:hypothetical protein
MTRPFSLFLPAILAGCASSASVPDPRRSEELRSDAAPICAPTGAPAQGSLPSDGGEEDLTGDGKTTDTTASSPDSTPGSPESALAFYRERYDANGDGRITRSEYTRSEAGFVNLDVDEDGVLTARDFASRWDEVPRGGQTKETIYAREGPDVGVPAPGFRLPSTTGEVMDLDQFRGKKPLVLAFGSFT